MTYLKNIGKLTMKYMA